MPKKSHPFLRRMLLQILTWNQYDLYYTARRLSLHQQVLMRVLHNKEIPAEDSQKIICYYFAYRECFLKTKGH